MAVLAFISASALSCGDSGDPSAPTGNVYGGVQYSAEVVLVSNTQGTVQQLRLSVQLANTTGVDKTRSYPAACPVRIRLYRVLDNARAYDETAIPCSPTPQGTIQVPANGTAVLSSGVRFPWSISGDSIPAGLYNARAVVMTEGTTEVEVEAGEYRLPVCETVGTSTVCS